MSSAAEIRRKDAYKTNKTLHKKRDTTDGSPLGSRDAQTSSAERKQQQPQKSSNIVSDPVYESFQSLEIETEDAEGDLIAGNTDVDPQKSTRVRRQDGIAFDSSEGSNEEALRVLLAGQRARVKKCNSPGMHRRIAIGTDNRFSS